MFKLPMRCGSVTDITYIRTMEGWLYVAVVLDLFSRQVVGWSVQPRIDRELAIGALLMAVWHRKPEGTVIVHSDQGSQFTSHDWQSFLKAHNLLEHEPAGQLPRQRSGRELLSAPAARANPSQDVQHS